MFATLLLESGFGSLGIVWRQAAGGPRVHRVFLSRAGCSAHELIQEAFPGADLRSAQPVVRLADQVGRFLAGENVSFDLSILAFDGCSEFQTRVLMAECQIPRGWVSTYGQIARHLGVPGGARAVGGALARNPFPIVIPCHRAIRSDGRVGGFQGGADMKRALLALEGVEFSATGRVLGKRFTY